jgi:predicted transposase YdaD
MEAGWAHGGRLGKQAGRQASKQTEQAMHVRNISRLLALHNSRNLRNIDLDMGLLMAILNSRRGLVFILRLCRCGRAFRS